MVLPCASITLPKTCPRRSATTGTDHPSSTTPSRQLSSRQNSVQETATVATKRKGKAPTAIASSRLAA
ncbi:hypothetical protein U1Q18_022832 [Sarracenia purpurea var. burkii]